MPRLHLNVLGPLVLEADGIAQPLAPRHKRVLLRLLLANGSAVASDDIHRDVWRDGAPAPAGRSRRAERGDQNQVQKCIHHLRHVLDPGAGDASTVLRTVQTPPTTSYQLQLPVAAVDLFRFRDGIMRAQAAPDAAAAALLSAALPLWRDAPLREIAHLAFGRRAAEELTALRARARQQLIDCYGVIGRVDLAYQLSLELREERPNDPALVAQVLAYRGQREQSQPGLAYRDFAGGRTRVVITDGDLFDQKGAHLIVGFTDTFDTATKDNVVINAGSVQGQLLEKVYEGDQKRLDGDLVRALRETVPLATEARSDKKHGKRNRYPIGTVAALRHRGITVFCVAYSRMRNDLRAQSSLEMLDLSLARLWEAVDRHGQMEPVAIPLVGAGLARIDFTSYEQLVKSIVGSFVQRSRIAPVAGELRLVLRAQELERLNVSDLVGYLEEL